MNEQTSNAATLDECKLASTGWMREKPMFEEAPVDGDDMEFINQFASRSLKPEQVYARSMFLCSTQPCLSDGCQFTRIALEEIARRVVGLSVLTGHDRTALPLARFYKASVVQRGSDELGEPVYFVRAWFYWLRDTSGSKDLLLNIDGGIYREVSLAWRYDSWRCSICHSPNGNCGHRAGATYNGRQCFRQIDKITEVLEGSLVYKSADKNTYLTGARCETDSIRNECLLLIGDRDDPIFPLLESYGAIQERHEYTELEETLTHGVDTVWIRTGAAGECENLSGHLLIGGGEGLGEIVSSSCSNQSLWGELLAINRSDSSRIQIHPFDGRKEDGHGSVRTV